MKPVCVFVPALWSVACAPAGRVSRVSEAAETTAVRPRATAAESAEPPAADRLVEVVAHSDATCVRTLQGKVACFGGGVTAGDAPEPRDSTTAVRIDVPPSAQIVAGVGFWCSRDADGGRPRCWGANGTSQLGRRTAHDVDFAARPVWGVDESLALAAYGDRACAVLPDAVVWCWGGERLARKVEIEGWSTRIGFAAADTICRQGPLACWEGGQAVKPRRETTSAIAGQATAAFGFAGASFSGTSAYGCAIGTSGDVRCQGGHRSFGATRLDAAGPPIAFAEDELFAVGASHACGGGVDGRIWCAGSNIAGQRGTNPTLHADGEPNYPSVPAVRSVAAGRFHTCVITERDAELWCWGLADLGQIGQRIAAGNKRPQRIDLDYAVTRVLAKGEHTCVEAEDGLHCSGWSGGECGTAGFGPAVAPPGAQQRLDADRLCFSGKDGESRCADSVGTGAKVVDLPAGIEAGGLRCSLDGGRVACRGRHRGRERSALPLEYPLGRGRDYTAILGSWRQLCGVHKTGALTCSPGRDSPRTSAPTTLSARKAKLDPNAAHLDRLALRRDGTIVSIALEEGRIVLSAVVGPQGVRVVATEGNETCAVGSGGELWCWGATGRVRRELEDVDVVGVANGDAHTCAVDNDGGLWCWGDNEHAELGNGAQLCSDGPVNATAAVADALGLGAP